MPSGCPAKRAKGSNKHEEEGEKRKPRRVGKMKQKYIKRLIYIQKRVTTAGKE